MRRCLNGRWREGLLCFAHRLCWTLGGRSRGGGRKVFHGDGRDCFVSQRRRSAQIQNQEGGIIVQQELLARKTLAMSSKASCKVNGGVLLQGDLVVLFQSVVPLLRLEWVWSL